MREVTGESPVLLLDDVLSELDESRRKALMELAFDCQCLMTSTNAESFDFGGKKPALFEVKNGNIMRNYYL